MAVLTEFFVSKDLIMNNNGGIEFIASIDDMYVFDNVLPKYWLVNRSKNEVVLVLDNESLLMNYSYDIYSTDIDDLISFMKKHDIPYKVE